jgi:hypothetical protein
MFHVECSSYQLPGGTLNKAARNRLGFFSEDESTAGSPFVGNQRAGTSTCDRVRKDSAKRGKMLASFYIIHKIHACVSSSKNFHTLLSHEHL